MICSIIKNIIDLRDLKSIRLSHYCTMGCSVIIYTTQLATIEGITMSDLKQKFEESVNYVQNAEGNFKPSNELKLQMYALFKQASEGDVSGKKPGRMDFINRAKYEAWEKCKGQSPDDAMQNYIDSIETLKSENG